MRIFRVLLCVFFLNSPKAPSQQRQISCLPLEWQSPGKKVWRGFWHILWTQGTHLLDNSGPLSNWDKKSCFCRAHQIWLTVSSTTNQLGVRENYGNVYLSSLVLKKTALYYQRVQDKYRPLQLFHCLKTSIRLLYQKTFWINRVKKKESKQKPLQIYKPTVD